MENQSPDINISHTSPAPPLGMVPQSYSTPALLQHLPPANQAMNGAGGTKPKKGPHLRIVEQPAKNDQRFRYVVEGRSAGSIKGVNWTQENNSFPTIEIVNYNKPVVVVVSCVTKDEPYRPHPHKVVGRDGNGQKYKDGICEVTLNEAPFRASFNNLGIQCTKKKDMEESLEERRKKNVNPFKTPYTKDHKNDYALHEVRLCFQAFINPTGKSWQPLDPVVSDPIIDKKAITDLVICELCSCVATVKGGQRIILLCEKVDKNDIRVKFTEYDSQGGIKWYAYADFQPKDVHKQTAITFITPRYERTDVTEDVKVYIQLERPTDKTLSKPLEFTLTPDKDSFTKRKRLRSCEDVRNYVSLHSNGQFSNTSNNGFTNPFGATPELKVEQMTSPEYYGNQNSPYTMVPSPSPQSPQNMGMHYTSLSPSQSSTNPFLLPLNNNETTMNTLPPPITQLPTMSGGNFTPLCTNQQQQLPTTTTTTTTEAPMESSSLSSVDRIVDQMVTDFVAANVHNNNNMNDLNYTVNVMHTAQAEPIPAEEEGLTASGLINMLASDDLLQISNLSVN